MNSKSASHKVVFIVPLISSKVARNWASVLYNLNVSLKSVLGQSNDNYEILIVSHDNISDFIPKDKRLINIVVDFSAPNSLQKGDGDKIRKLMYAGMWLSKNNYDNFYAFFLDADDLVASNLVDAILSKNEEAYLFEQGYIYDHSTGVVALEEHGFFGLCGSSFATKLYHSELPKAMNDKSHYYHFLCSNHSARGSFAIAWNKQIVPFGSPSVLYIVNHSSSLENHKKGRRSTVDYRNKYPFSSSLKKIFSQYSSYQRILTTHGKFVCLNKTRSGLVQMDNLEDNDYVLYDPLEKMLKTSDSKYVAFDDSLRVKILDNSVNIDVKIDFTGDETAHIYLKSKKLYLSARTDHRLTLSSNKKAWELYKIVF